VRARLWSIAARLLRRRTLSDIYDEQTIAVMKRVLDPESTCIDVGASRGGLLAHMVRLAPRGSHLAFEPLPEFAHLLRVKFPRVRVYQLALSNITGKATYQHVISNPAYSGLLRRAYPRPNEVLQEIIVETARLDDLIPGDLSVRFIKIDVEGAERQVLEGAVATIRRSRPYIVFEFGIGAADYYGTQAEQIFTLLSSCGLQISLMFSWLAGEGCLSLEQFDSAPAATTISSPTCRAAAICRLVPGAIRAANSMRIPSGIQKIASLAMFANP
jgi:FkbM family methyltransferase